MSLNPEMKILLVEDSKITRKMEIRILKELGFNNIVEADDGELAIQKLREDEEIDLIISDWNMPNRGGGMNCWYGSDRMKNAVKYLLSWPRPKVKKNRQ